VGERRGLGVAARLIAEGGFTQRVRSATVGVGRLLLKTVGGRVAIPILGREPRGLVEQMTYASMAAKLTCPCSGGLAFALPHDSTSIRAGPITAENPGYDLRAFIPVFRELGHPLGPVLVSLTPHANLDVLHLASLATERSQADRGPARPAWPKPAMDP
jgi:hypothetical protein